MLTCTLRFLRYACVLVIVGFFVGAITYFSFRELIAVRVNSRNKEVEKYDITMPEMLGQINSNRRYAVFSTTSAKHADSLGFIFMLPLTALAWKRIGFDSVVIIVGSEDLWNSDPLLYMVLSSLRHLDAVVIFLNVHPANSVMVSQVCPPYFTSICVPARGLRGLQPLRRAKPPFFRANAKFFGQKPAAKNEKKIFIKRKQRNSFLSAR